jgi:hypothetical protein
MSMCVLTDQERQPQVWKMLSQAFVPEGRTLWTRRIITAIRSGARITKSHRKDSNLRFIAKSGAIQT